MARTDDTLVDAAKLVDEMTSGRRLAGVDMANDHDVEMGLRKRQHTSVSNPPSSAAHVHTLQATWRRISATGRLHAPSPCPWSLSFD